jgi:SWI/SNF-related matrix-associated actin-dependent regulator of chromatin subfamily A member 5
MIFVDKLVKRSIKDKNQILIFSGFTTMLDILEDFCNFREVNYCRLDGSTDLMDRERQIADFVAPDSQISVFLISTRAGGLGLNLMTANIVVLFDSDWNPQIDLQAMDRAHRIGQKKVVQVFRLVTQDTMEEKNDRTLDLEAQT